ncbi:hypothetical protein [Halanaerobium salsuginis]|jgi:hypothetical protein|uniref:Dihydrodipicolinate synthase/N-acetylneuraminate lyase n=1 Tax=Halanaerobium salsuginis TaxID=29563 RepID=A0A1I4G4C2_9FIRM|nr:hypothetical protein [Halanaerobium salsuginis]SFL23921.1 Dihydrodipicolinate synthase/N-acetylneuraminate lyase [Halanaerobium salsuginis]
MKYIYSSLLYFLNDFDLKEAEFLIENNFKNGINNFYLSKDNFKNNLLICDKRLSFYQEIIKMIPDSKGEIIVDISSCNFDSKLKTIDKLKYSTNVKFVFEIPFSYHYYNRKDKILADYNDYLTRLEKYGNKDFYVKISSRFLDENNKDNLFQELAEFKQIKGLLTIPEYPYDFDLEEMSQYPAVYKDRFSFFSLSDDFYYLNLKHKLNTISRYVNIVPDYFKQITTLFKKSNYFGARDKQAELNEVIKNIELKENKFNYDELLAEFTDKV